MGAQNFNIDSKFPQNKSFSASKFVFFDEEFLTRRRFSDSPKFRGEGCLRGHDPLIALKYEAAPPCPSWSSAPLLPDAFRLLLRYFATLLMYTVYEYNPN